MMLSFSLSLSLSQPPSASESPRKGRSPLSEVERHGSERDPGYPYAGVFLVQPVLAGAHGVRYLRASCILCPAAFRLFTLETHTGVQLLPGHGACLDASWVWRKPPHRRIQARTRTNDSTEKKLRHQNQKKKSRKKGA